MTMIGVNRHVQISRERDREPSSLVPHPTVEGAKCHREFAERWAARSGSNDSSTKAPAESGR